MPRDEASGHHPEGVTFTDHSLAVTRKQHVEPAEAMFGGFYVLRTPVPAAELDAAAVVTAYKDLKYAGRDFRHIESTTWTCGRSSTGSRNASRPTS